MWINKIRLVEIETRQEFANFDGVELSKAGSIFQPFILDSHLLTIYEDFSSWTHVKEIANTGLLVSVHHTSRNSANLELFDVSRKGQAKKIYSFEEVFRGLIFIS